MQIGGSTFAPSSQGQGFRDLPADGTSPSRFIRALTIARFASPPADQQSAELGTIRVLHGLDIVPGTVEETGAQGSVPELTMWSTVSYLTANRYLVNVFSGPQSYSIDLATLDITSSRSRPLPSGGAPTPLSI